MAEVLDVIFCLQSTNIDGQGVSANNILTTISPEYIPGLFTFSVIITTIGITRGEEHQIRIEFISPNNEHVVDLESVLPIVSDDNNSNLPDEYKDINIAMDWNNVNLKMSGLYTIKISLDGTFLKEKTIFVKGKNE